MTQGNKTAACLAVLTVSLGIFLLATISAPEYQEVVHAWPETEVLPAEGHLVEPRDAPLTSSQERTELPSDRARARAATSSDTQPRQQNPLGEASLVFTMHSSAGEPLDGSLSLRSGDGRRYKGIKVRGGRGRAKGLTPGAWVAEGRSTGYASQRVEVECAAGTTAKVHLRLTRAKSCGIALTTPSGALLRFASEGENAIPLQVREALVVTASTNLTSATNARLEGKLVISERGSWMRFDQGSRPGALTVYGAQPLFVSVCLNEQVLATKWLEEIPRKLTFQVDPGEFFRELSELRVQILDGERRTPLRTAKISLRNKLISTKAEVSDEEGRATLASQAGGVYQVLVEAMGYPLHIQEVQLPREEPLEVALSRAVPISLRFRKPNGDPTRQILRFYPYLPDAPEDALAFPPALVCSTDRASRVEGAVLAAAHWLVIPGDPSGTIRPAWLPDAFTLDLTDGVREERTVIVAPTTELRLQASQASSMSQVTLYQADGLPFTRFTRPAETFFLRLPRGTWTLATSQPAGPPLEIEIELGESPVQQRLP